MGVYGLSVMNTFFVFELLPILQGTKTCISSCIHIYTMELVVLKPRETLWNSALN
jgi:hypothetical protein